MRRNYSYQQKKRNYFVAILIFLFVVIVAMVKSISFYSARMVNDFSYPYLNLSTISKNSTFENSRYLGMNKLELIAKINEMEEKNKVLTEQLVLFNDLEKQNRELRIQKNLPAKDNFIFINGEIIIRDPINWFDIFTINRGGRDGVKEGSAVFTFDQNSKPLLIGVVSEVYKHSSKVISLSSSAFKISGKLAISENVGLINFNENRYRTNNQYVSIDLLPNTGSYVIGEELYTTGVEENIPAGIKIGNLESLDKDNSPYSNQLYVSGMISIKNNFVNSRFISIAIKNSL